MPLLDELVEGSASYNIQFRPYHRDMPCERGAGAPAAARRRLRGASSSCAESANQEALAWWAPQAVALPPSDLLQSKF